MSESQEPRDRRLIASAILIGLILVAGIIVVVMRLIGGDDNTADPNPSPTASQGADSSSACGLPNGDQTLPTTAPETAWSLQGKMAAPSSPEYGPGKEAAGIHSCFAHSPVGALFASVRFYSDAFALGDELGSAFIERWYTDGPAKESALALAKRPGTDESDRSPIPQQVAGFRIDNYTAGRVTTTLVTRESEGPTAGELRAFPVTVVWTDGDWKVDADNTTSSTPSRIASLSGFIAWSGV